VTSVANDSGVAGLSASSVQDDVTRLMSLRRFGRLAFASTSDGIGPKHGKDVSGPGPGACTARLIEKEYLMTDSPPPPDDTEPEVITGVQQITPPRGGYTLPRALIILLGIAAGVVVAAGIHSVPNIIGPVFMAVVLVVTLDPIRSALIRKGAPRWLATLAVVLGVYAIVLGLFVAAIVGIAQLAALMPQYADQFEAQLSGIKSWLSGMGVTQEDVQNALSNIDKSSIISFARSLLSSIGDIFSSVLFLIVLVIFMGVDGSVFGERMISRRPGREPVLTALGTFAAGTRKYFAVATIFGGIVAILDGVALIILGIPAAGLWALLAFVTNYVPNIGFLIGLVPPALLALLTGGPSLMITVIVVYCVLNFIIQSVLQPKFVGDAVGLTTTMSFLSLIIWAYLLGPIGAILAIPASLLFKALLVDVDPDARWLQLFLGDEPVFKVKDPNRPKRFSRKKVPDPPAIAAGDTAPA
jgi:predicted PurR-regulated permease PerM